MSDVSLQVSTGQMRDAESDEDRSKMAWGSTMPVRLVKRRKELGVEAKDFANMIRFLTFVINGITLPAS
jgi:hypothetical protein